MLCAQVLRGNHAAQHHPRMSSRALFTCRGTSSSLCPEHSGAVFYDCISCRHPSSGTETDAVMSADTQGKLASPSPVGRLNTEALPSCLTCLCWCWEHRAHSIPGFNSPGTAIGATGVLLIILIGLWGSPVFSQIISLYNLNQD